MRRPLFLAALFLVGAAAFRLWSGWGDGVPPGQVSVMQLDTAGELLVTGQVYQKDETSVYLRSVILLESNAGKHSGADSRGEIPCQENIICEIQQAKEIPLGSFVAVRGVFYPCSHATNPGEFDSAVYYRSLGIGGRLKKAEIMAKGNESWPLREGLFRLKCYFKERLYRLFPEKEAAVMSALLLGDKKDLDSELKDLYKRNGILHILSISSLHITIIGMSVYRLLRKFGLPVPPAAVGGSVLLFLYGCMTGFGVSACRAIGMYLIKMLGEITGRTYDMLTALGVMAAVMAAGNPYYLQNSGFLLSFTSVLGIGVVYPVLAPEPGRVHCVGKEKEERLRKAGEALLQSAFASLSITLTTLPVQLWFYYEIPVYSVFLNLFVLPFMKPMMITGLLALGIPGLGVLGWIDYWILRAYEFLCGCFDRLPFHTWNPGCPGVWQITAYYLLLAAGMGIGFFRRRHLRTTEAAEEKASGGRKAGAWLQQVFLCAAVLMFAISVPAANSVFFLDVGQGDCIVVRTASGRNYLFDCGSSSRSSIGKYVLIPFLKYYGIRNIHGVFLSHPDADHINGALELLRTGQENNIRVGQLLLPAVAESARAEQLGEVIAAAGTVPIGYLSSGDSFGCGSAVFTCLHPPEGFDAGDVNGYSECFFVEFLEDDGSFLTGGKRRDVAWTMLLTGDVQNEGEAALLEELCRRDIRDITILKAAHHGSRNSTPQELLSRLSPALTVISSGRNNRYGHPHEELLERLEESGTAVAMTARWGAITVSFRQGGIAAVPFHR